METLVRFYLRLAGKILATVLAISLVIVLIGYFLQWNEPVKFTNAFFWAGAILIVLGVMSVTGGFVQRANFNITYAETAGTAGIGERNWRTADDVAQRYGSMIMMTVAGILLIVISTVIG